MKKERTLGPRRPRRSCSSTARGWITTAFGDAKVDLPMFEACGYGVAMGNGGDEIRAAADYVTGDVDKNGLYQAFAYLKLI